MNSASAAWRDHCCGMSSLPVGIEVSPSIRFGGGQPFALIAGPCVIESEEHVRHMAAAIGAIAGPFVFKASFDKANRTSASAYRGPGLAEGLRILAGVKAAGFPVLTDIHEPAQAGPVAEVADILQIPAFLCRQTDLLMEAGRTGRIVNIKKGQFGYNNLVVDMRGLPVMRGFGWPVVFDATHSVQLPGGAGSASGGQPQYIETLARAAVGAGIDGLFLEVHDAPEKALSDGANALRIDKLGALLRRLRAVDELVKGNEFLESGS